MHLPDQVLAGILMYSFPSSYEPIKMTLSTLKKEDFTFAAVSRAMLNEEQRRITSGSLPTYNGSAEPSAYATFVHRMPCNWCGLDNHLAAQCHSESVFPSAQPLKENKHWRSSVIDSVALRPLTTKRALTKNQKLTINPASLRSHDRMSARPSFTCCCARVSYVWQYDCTVGTKLCGFVLAVMAVMC